MPEEGWNRQRAEAELRHVLADVERGIWRPPEPAPTPEIPEEPTFHEFASRWLDAVRVELRPSTVENYQWALGYHLLPFFADHRLGEITIAEVDRYKVAKLREGKLAAAQINQTLKRLAQILDLAIEYGQMDGANPARGRRRRAKAPKPQRTWVEPEQLLALIEASDQTLRPLLATLAGGGLRLGEAIALDWPDVSLATATLRVRESKTDAGAGRVVDLPSGAIEALSEWKAYKGRRAAGGPVFVTRTGRRQTVTNVDHRIKTAIARANRRLAELAIEPISERVTPHSLRRTYASLRAAAGDHPVYIAEQLGHEDPGFTFRVYQRAAKRRDRLNGAHLEAFENALDWAAMGSESPDRRLRDRGRRMPEGVESAQ
jgi:integrase